MPHHELLSTIDGALIEVKSEISDLTAEIERLSVDCMFNTNNNKVQKSPSSGSLDKQIDKIHDLREKSLAVTAEIKNRVEKVFKQVGIAEVKADEVDDHLRHLKKYLKDYYNSAFFSEDS